MLSQKATDFLTDLKVYLRTYGKDEKEIQEIVDELEDHILQAEKDGKRIEEITGDSPKAYMDQLRAEMKTDRKEIQSVLLLFFPLALAFVVLPDALRGKAAYTLLDIVGNLAAFSIGLGMFILFLRMESSRTLSAFTRILMYGLIGAVPLGMFLGIKLANDYMEISPVFVATPLQNVLIAAACAIFLIGYAIFARTWVVIVVPCLSIAPNFIADIFTSTPQNHAMVSLGIMFAGIALFLWYLSAQNKRKSKAS
ncbi:HAAS domain-containing protein [Paenibacillus puerhi]|uniref:HAAS domain-containing protein n=1 Tax=Paenibacillus puerhi TaxID=2692622 RepID=UPI001359464C|nr:DUF1129 family protein [Paenibacillus puerhi]